MPTLYIVPTPIGNLEDITLRALRVLEEADLIAAEDTRVTRKLLSRYSITTPTTAFHEHNRARKTPYLLSLLPEKDIALVSDAGTPTINDPGQQLVSAAARAGFDVVALPGASAVTTAIAVSGVHAEGFVYLGYLPARKAARVKFLSELASARRDSSPTRRRPCRHLWNTFGDRRIAVCRELTKMHEEVFRGSISDAIRPTARGIHPGHRGRGELMPQVSRLKERGLTARDVASPAFDGYASNHLHVVRLSQAAYHQLLP